MLKGNGMRSSQYYSKNNTARKFVPGIFLLLLGCFLFLPVSDIRAQDEDLFGNAPPAAAPAPQKADPAPPANVPDPPDAPVPAAADESGSPQAPNGGEASSNSGRGDNYLIWMIRSLGIFFTPVFAFLSLAMVALVVMNILSIRRSTLVPEELVHQFGTLLDDSKFQEAYQVAREDESLLGKVLAAGLSRVPSGYDKAVQAMQDVGQEETMRMEHRIGYLALIGNLAPMIGLFGTVVGMIDSFQVIAAGGAAPSPQKLAEGIATALFTTMVGLAIALPSLAIYDVFKNRLARYILEIGIISDNFMGRFSNTAPKNR
ncbi:MAG: MotA/TolQ/ExbB proton channel family protein [Planctomycetia bacterium]|nr:MotA/TolQ/ExbB proton channel family protein [Planctomycetia bacterium]